MLAIAAILACVRVGFRSWFRGDKKHNSSDGGNALVVDSDVASTDVGSRTFDGDISLLCLEKTDDMRIFWILDFGRKTI